MHLNVFIEALNTYEFFSQNYIFGTQNPLSLFERTRTWSGVDDHKFSSKDPFSAIASDPESMSFALQVL